ncbi:MAG: EAL domain-containing protein [Clostridiales bacterium]|nr:EAL domain-containing protein [Clostridiales bacterium]
MNQLPAAGEGTGIYVIDGEFRVVYFNETAKAVCPNLRVGDLCYRGICNGSAPCSSCPDRNEDCSRLLLYDAVNRQWIELSSGRIEWPGHGRCRLMLFKVVDRQSMSLFYDLTETSAYEELFELNLAENTYKILFHQNGKYVIPDMEGRLDSMCMEVADHMICPEDRERFLEFWNFDTLAQRLSGNNHTIRGEFRKLLVSGEYCWVAQTAIQLHTGEQDKTVIMVFIQDIDKQKKQEIAAANSGKSGLEEKDSMMGLYRYGPFLERAEQFLRDKSGSKFSMVAIDIEHFKLFNEWYGEEAGDRFLTSIAEQLKEVEKQYDSMAGYMGGDDFAIIIPREESVLRNLERGIRHFVKQYGGSVGFLPAFGVYEIEEWDVSVSMMYDRASIALASVKGNYLNRMGRYDAGMKKKMEDDQLLLSEVQRALDNHEFIFYAQPQCNMLTGKIIGLESLVRWKHPVRGVVQPGEFIPLLERNGFITNLDLYVWDMVCARLHDWIAAGHKPVPIAVNVSRIDIYSMNVTNTFVELTGRYGIDPALLAIEITESAYAEDYNLIRQVVIDLRKAGFTVFMDDFGSGYSSLNMLKDVNVDVIKIDTKFLDMNEHSQNRGMGILETIVRMARLTQLRVIAEGVEKKEHVDFLRNVGCIYGQGYYYYRPMPIEQFEPLLLDEENVDYRGILAHQLEELRLEDLVNKDVTSDAILNNMLGGMALYDVCGDKIELLQVNEGYYRVTGCNPVDLEERRKSILAQIHEEDRDKVFDLFETAYKNPLKGADGTIRRYRLNGELMWISLRIFFLKERDEHRLFYGSVSDVTEGKCREEKLIASRKILADVLNINGEEAEFGLDEIMALSREVKECRKRLGELERCRLAETDPLTGLHNGKTAVPLMKEWIARRRGQPSALVLFRFDGFKAVNEELGQINGERILVNSVEKLKRFFREEDIVCRIGGYEILVLCKNIGESDMRRKLEQLMADMKLELALESAGVRPSINAGYVMTAGGGTDFDDLYEKARQALKMASARGKGICMRCGQEITD